MYRTSFVLILCSLPCGCSSSGTTGGQAQESDAQVAEHIKALIPEASSLPIAQWHPYKEGASIPNIEDMPNQALSLVLLSMKQSPKEKETFAFETDEFGAGMLSAWMERSKLKGYATLLQPEFITECTCSVQKDKAEGTLSFRDKGHYHGKVDYTARKTDSGWRIEEFRLSGFQIRVQLEANGRWKMSKM